MAYFPSYKVVITLAILLLSLSSSSAYKQNPFDNNKLYADFYSQTCPNLLTTVSSAVQEAIKKEPRMGASLLRLHFHDCFVNGCDASVLLDDTSSFKGEKGAAPNKNSARGFEIIDTIKTNVEKVCNNTVSCADILAIVARDSVVQLGGSGWKVKLGRRDSLSASLAAANNGSIPGPTSSLANLTSRFKQLGLTTKDLVALSGINSLIDQITNTEPSRCTSFRNRIYNDNNINGSFVKERRGNCPKASGSGDNNLAPLDTMTPVIFDNNYFKNLIGKNGLLHSDQELFNGNPTDSIVNLYSGDQNTFNKDFAAAMIKMGDISPLIGPNQGQIRINCRKPN
ncbi:peroxidase 52 [Phtheirospermum japonicum]|uniref:Peroxidase n=1 Tax=Phtheirospermum japonicum TaxID=374723 RepID=A0A830D6U5_9LAMI|nr:peroxidase 52 [Phtheirospermum japonicum]